MSGVRGLDHINLRAPADVIEQVRAFYIDVIGLREGPRPAFRSGSHGHWLYAGDTAVLHLSIGPRIEPGDRPNGYFSHFALACSDLAAARERLDAAAVRYSIDVIEERNQVQLFTVDPAGVVLELDFQLDQQPTRDGATIG
jgi:catechol 2,3-dioxygenase-like lactoylglutathione lyase family enzyme